MSSPWQNPLPSQDYAKSPVVVYFYSDRWIPISCFCLNEALALYHKALRQGKKIFVFPPGLNLETKNILSSESSRLPGELASR
jgi:hypothetical protein